MGSQRRNNTVYGFAYMPNALKVTKIWRRRARTMLQSYAKANDQIMKSMLILIIHQVLEKNGTSYQDLVHRRMCRTSLDGDFCDT
jgi:hypothetical protein